MEQPDFSENPGRERTIDMMNGNAIRMIQSDPYGLIHLSLLQGDLPQKYKGFYTDWRSARQAVDHYLEERNIAEGTAPPRPVIQYKNTPKPKE